MLFLLTSLDLRVSEEGFLPDSLSKATGAHRLAACWKSPDCTDTVFCVVHEGYLDCRRMYRVHLAFDCNIRRVPCSDPIDVPLLFETPKESSKQLLRSNGEISRAVRDIYSSR